eukprot:7073350-Prymnesium_polylepis.1
MVTLATTLCYALVTPTIHPWVPERHHVCEDIIIRVSHSVTARLCGRREPPGLRRCSVWAIALHASVSPTSHESMR